MNADEKARAFGSASMRSTCPERTSGSCSRPAAASAIRSSSGMLIQRKYESREAS